MPRLALAAGAACGCALAVPEATGLAGDTPRIHLKAMPRIDAHATRATRATRATGASGAIRAIDLARAPGTFIVSGTVTDDTGTPDLALMGAGRVRLSLSRELGPQPARTLPPFDAARAGGAATEDLPLASALPEGCGGNVPGDPSRLVEIESAFSLLLPTDEAGRFCVRLTVPQDRYVARLTTTPSGFFDSAMLELAVNLALKTLTLRFSPPPPPVDLDESTTAVGVEASTEEDGVATPAPGTFLRLTNEVGEEVGDGVTDAAGHALFVAPSVRFGSAGHGELHVTFAGNDETGSGVQRVPIERRAHVRLDFTDAKGGRLPPGVPDEGVAIRVGAAPECARRGCAATPSGIVGVYLGEVLVGAAQLDRGRARVIVTFAAPWAEDVSLRVRYVPDAPWFQAGADVGVALPARVGNGWGKFGPALTGLAVAAWFIFTRIPSRLRSRGVPRKQLRGAAAHTRPLTAALQLVRASSEHQAWTGRVVDVHEGTPIEGARVRIERAGFERLELIAEATSDANGSFALSGERAMPGDQIAIEATAHVPLRRPLPPSGHLEVSLVFRKRDLVGRMVEWAKKRGGRFDAKGDPTPAHVWRTAGPQSSIAGWAEAIERAAYGGGLLDAEAQALIDRMSPEAFNAGPPLSLGVVANDVRSVESMDPEAKDRHVTDGTDDAPTK